MRGLASSFFMLGRIKTTEAKAKELRPLAEKMLTRGRRVSPANRRYLVRHFSDATARYVIERAQSLGGRPGGYTRIIKLGQRRRDTARMAMLELIKE